MALEEYRRKRDFGKTSEPPPDRVRSRSKQFSYLIQKHDATRLHYDFRLELDGVLLSWAVTRGPSVDPADKRLAVRTEDHPLAYGSFEGTIPKGEYGGGTVMLWDRGTWTPKSDPHVGLKKGHLAFELHGERLKGGWNLVRMRRDEKGENWLLIKETDQASARGSNGAFLEGLAYSVTTGRSMDEIARGARPVATRLRKSASLKPVLARAKTRGMGAGEWRAVPSVKPDLFREVAPTEWTEDGRIRHPAFQGLREDKDASGVKQEKPMPTAVSVPSKGAKTAALVAAGITISHPGRVISETGHITKGELAQYHAAIAPFMLPRIARHPLSLLRCPSGIDGKQCFFQRSPGRGLGKHVQSFEFQHQGKRHEYLYIEEEKGLLEIIQMGAIELHPWGASVDAIDFPDRLIFDLGPAPDVPFEALKLAATDLRQRLKKRGLDSSLKCTGGKGLHVTVALAGKDRWPQAKTFGAAIAEEMVSATPEAYVATMSKAKRAAKTFIDYFRNDYTATAVADYGVRARPGAPVAVPLAWEELKGLKSASAFTMKDVLKRLKNRKPAAPPKGQVLPS